MSELGVGKEVLSFCNPCKATLAHMILSMKTVNEIGKVQCKTCKAIHTYKDPSKISAKKNTTKGASAKAAKISIGPKRKSASISDMWLEAVNNSTKKSQAYSIKSQYHVGDILDHPKFGPGVIDRLIDSDKIEVIFRHEIKTLIHNK